MTDGPGIHIHEDDWGMRCLYPLAAAAGAAADVHAAEAAGLANRAPDGVGWTDVHVIRAPEHDYAEAGLTFAAADAVLAPILPRVRRFAATASAGFTPGDRDPYGHYEDDAHCYGLDSSCFVKLDGEAPLVRRVWFQAETGDPARLQALRRAIVALDGLVVSVIADYCLDRVGAAGDPVFLDGYLRAVAGTD